MVRYGPDQVVWMERKAWNKCCLHAEDGVNHPAGEAMASFMEMATSEWLWNKSGRLPGWWSGRENCNLTDRQVWRCTGIFQNTASYPSWAGTQGWYRQWASLADQEALQTLQRGWASSWDEALWELETLSDSFRIVTRLLCGGENRKPEHPLKGIRRSSLGSSGELEPLRTGNQPTFFLGLWHAPDTLTAISLIAGEILAYGVVNLYKMLLRRELYSRAKWPE